MPVFYFNVRCKGKIILDSAGAEMVDIDDARACALSFARNIVARKVECGEVLGDETFEISDRAGIVLATIPFRDAIRDNDVTAVRRSAPAKLPSLAVSRRISLLDHASENETQDGVNFACV